MLPRPRKERSGLLLRPPLELYMAAAADPSCEGPAEAEVEAEKAALFELWRRAWPRDDEGRDSFAWLLPMVTGGVSNRSTGGVGEVLSSGRGRRKYKVGRQWPNAGRACQGGRVRLCSPGCGCWMWANE